MITRDDRIEAIANAIAEGLTDAEAHVKAQHAVNADPLTAMADRLQKLYYEADVIKSKVRDIYEYWV
jgi:uncharacterized protein Yka (UPF0111/DUF47 family)